MKNKNKEVCFIFRVRNFMPKRLVDKFYSFNEYKKILLFDDDVSYKNLYTENDSTKIVTTSKERYLLVSHLVKEGTLNKL